MMRDSAPSCALSVAIGGEQVGFHRRESGRERHGQLARVSGAIAAVDDVGSPQGVARRDDDALRRDAEGKVARAHDGGRVGSAGRELARAGRHFGFVVIVVERSGDGGRRRGARGLAAHVHCDRARGGERRAAVEREGDGPAGLATVVLAAVEKHEFDTPRGAERDEMASEDDAAGAS